jgi:hypothetical protein
MPRKLELKSSDAQGYTLIQQPIDALKALRKNNVSANNISISGVQNLSSIFAPQRNVYEVEATFIRTNAIDENFGINFCVGSGISGSDKVTLNFDANTNRVYLDRMKSGNISFSDEFPSIYSAPVPEDENTIKFHVFIDQSSIEVFINDGSRVMSALIYPEETSLGIELFSNSGTATLQKFSAYELNSSWNPTKNENPQIIYNGEDVNPQWENLFSTVQNNVANPLPDTINSSMHCVAIERKSTDDDNGGKPFSGAALWNNNAVSISGIDYDKFSMQVLKNVTGRVVLELQHQGKPNQFIESTYTTIGQWQELVFLLDPDFKDTISNILVHIHSEEAGTFVTQTMYWDNLKALRRYVPPQAETQNANAYLFKKDGFIQDLPFDSGVFTNDGVRKVHFFKNNIATIGENISALDSLTFKRSNTFILQTDTETFNYNKNQIHEFLYNDNDFIIVRKNGQQDKYPYISIKKFQIK